MTPAAAAEPFAALPRRATTVLLVLACALATVLVWALLNRPVTPPDFHGRVAGVAFSPFQRGQSPEDGTFPTPDEIRADLGWVAALTDRVRSYTVDGAMGELPRLAAGLQLKLTLGAWLARDAGSNTRELDRLIAVTRGAGNVERVIVGNEAVLRGDLTVSQLIADLGHVRAGVGVPVSTAEPWHVWLKHPELAASVDFLTVHLLPYWEGVPVGDAERFLMQKLALVHAAYPGKPIVIGEVGWPSDGVAIGGAHASRVNQALFLRRFFNDARRRGLDYFVMEAFDQPWKTSFEGRAAGYWGMLDLDRNAKWPLAGPVEEFPRWPAWALLSTGAAALPAWLLLSRRPDIRPAGTLAFAAVVQVFGAGLTIVLVTMGQKYLSPAAGAVWGALAAGQGLLLLLVLGDGFELAEAAWGRVWRRCPRLAPAAAGAVLPKVSIHIPVCNEPPHMVRQTLDALARLDYPDFEVLVIDNNTDDPALWEPVAEHCARLGARFRFFHLGRWLGFKAGALNFALRETAADAEIIAVLDSDYVVQPDWLRCTAPQFAEPRVGIVQSPQDYRDAGEGRFKRLMFWEYAGFFHIGMVTRNERNAIIQHGTMTLIRAAALREAGGWAEWCIVEDAELGLRLFRHGWQAVYSSRSFGRGVMPDDFSAWCRQRFRWSYGAMQICRRHASALFSPFNGELTPGQRWHFITGWMPWVGDALGLFFLLVGLAWSVGLIVAPMRVEFPIAAFMLPSIGLFGLRLAQLLVLYRARVPCPLPDRLGAAVAGLALSHTIAIAVWKGLLTRGAPFRRTPKMRAAPALVRGLWMARAEFALGLLTLGAMTGVGVAHHMATPEARLWCLVLLTQSLPYAASVFVSVAAALPARRPRALPAPRATPQAEWQPTAAGD
jgi:exo-beta-1,3-glucanase (GH17 family)